MTGTSDISQDAIFVGANRQGHVADYSENLVAFGAAHNVALWNPLSSDKKGVHHTLKKHTHEVTCVRFIPDSPFLVSAGEDGQINIWSRPLSGTGNSHFQLYQSLVEEDCSITCISVHENKVFATGNSKGEVHLYQQQKDSQFRSVHSFHVKFNFYPLTLCLQYINDAYLLVVGGTSNDVFVYSVLAEDLTKTTLCAVMKGHEDWVKTLAFVAVKEGQEYLLASGSQDRYIRLWKLRLNDAIDDSDEDASALVLLSNKQYKFDLGTGRAAFSFDALIMGHDDWVTGLQWNPASVSDPSKLLLLSSSADTALMIWEMDFDSGIWVCATRLGEMSIKGASTATGSSGGFWSCLWFQNPTSDELVILANGKTGAIRVYRNAGSWQTALGLTGATKEVNDVVWAKSGEYLFMTSLDQTTRLMAPWCQNRPAESATSVTWHEFARPQIHGYDMICIDNLTSTKFVSGGDEKVLRVFEMTQSISELLHKFCNTNFDTTQHEALPEAASLPVLGLSNKAANEELAAGEAQQRAEDPESLDDAKDKVDVLEGLVSPPFEDYLQRHTLFPEIEKLYGHGYEITCCAVSPNGSLIASACRSNNDRHAVVRLFNVNKDYQLVEKVLRGHHLTITSLEFSANGKYLAAVSRDRQVSLWKVSDEENGAFDLIELVEKAHTRIVWDCSWAPMTEHGDFLVTGSRDKSIKLWKVTDDAVTQLASEKTGDPVTSVACFQKSLLKNMLVIAVGHESGDIGIYSANLDGPEYKLQKITGLDNGITPSGKIVKLAFSLKASNSSILLAVGSADHSLRIYTLDVDVLI